MCGSSGSRTEFGPRDDRDRGSAVVADYPGVGAVALAANLVCLALLWRYRAHDVNMSSTFECSRNNVIANLGVLAAAGGVVWAGLTMAGRPRRLGDRCPILALGGTRAGLGLARIHEASCPGARFRRRASAALAKVGDHWGDRAGRCALGSRRTLLPQHLPAAPEIPRAFPDCFNVCCDALRRAWPQEATDRKWRQPDSA